MNKSKIKIFIFIRLQIRLQVRRDILNKRRLFMIQPFNRDQFESIIHLKIFQFQVVRNGKTRISMKTFFNALSLFMGQFL